MGVQAVPALTNTRSRLSVPFRSEWHRSASWRSRTCGSAYGQEGWQISAARRRRGWMDCQRESCEYTKARGRHAVCCGSHNQARSPSCPISLGIDPASELDLAKLELVQERGRIGCQRRRAGDEAGAAEQAEVTTHMLSSIPSCPIALGIRPVRLLPSTFLQRGTSTSEGKANERKATRAGR